MIHNPDSLMRAVQFRILKNVLEKVEVPDYIHAFEKGRSIPAMAQQHVGKGIVVSFDLKNYFTSIKQVHLLKVFEELGFDKEASLTLAELCTVGSFVPQGALTSPKLSNVVTSLTFGPLVKAVAEAEGFAVSIYADDITLSHPDRHNTPEGRTRIRLLKKTVTNILGRYGFELNEEKTKIMRPHRRQYVCGIVVNEKPNLTRTERHALRAIVHNLTRNNLEYEAAKTNTPPAEFANQVQGRINWLVQVNPEQGNALMQQFRAAVGDMGQINAGQSQIEMKEVALPMKEVAESPF